MEDEDRKVFDNLSFVQVIFVGDSSFAALDLHYLVSSTPRVDLITRLRLDAQLYDPAPERKVA